MNSRPNHHLGETQCRTRAEHKTRPNSESPRKGPDDDVTGHSGVRGLTTQKTGVSFTLKPPGSYLGGAVGNTLEDPVHGRRIQGEVGGKLHALEHQLVLDRVPVNL